MVRAVELLHEVWDGLLSASLESALLVLTLLELFALASVPSVLLRRRGRPIAALAWLMTLFALPGLGGLAWWLMGRTTLERKRRRRVAKKRDFARQRQVDLHMPGTRFESYSPARAQGEDTFSSCGNRVELLADGKNYFPKLRQALREAKRCIHIEMYIFELDTTGESILSLLEEKAREGLSVRLLLDGWGSQHTARKISRRLRNQPIRVAQFLPTRLFPLHAPRLNFINHRKIIVIDDSIAFTGGMNIGEVYEHHWRDLMLRIEGPAVRALHHVFLDDWYFATDETTAEPESPEALADGIDAAVVMSGPDSEPWIHDAYFLAITQAQHSVTLVTPYFIPSQALTTAMRTAAGRGVSVRVVIPSRSDVAVVKWASRSYYRLLVESGVRIFEYDKAMVHAKALIQDDQVLSVGTANVDTRSMGLSFEVNCFLSDAGLGAQLANWLEGLIDESVEIDSVLLEQKGMLQKLGESAAHLLSPIL